MEQRMDSDCEGRRPGGFKHMLPLLVIPLGFALMRGLAHHKYGHMGAMRRKEWKNGVPPMFEEWHKRAHGETTEDKKE